MIQFNQLSNGGLCFKSIGILLLTELERRVSQELNISNY